MSPSVTDGIGYAVIREESEEDKVRDTDDEDQKDVEIEILDCEESISDVTENEIDKLQTATNKLFTTTRPDESTQRDTPNDDEDDNSIANCSLDRISPMLERLPRTMRRYKSINDLCTYKNLKHF